MARDVEINVTASDRTAPGLSSAERAFARAQSKMRKQQEETDKSIGKSLLQTAEKIAPKLTARLTEAFSAVSQYAVPILAGIGAAVAPLLGASIAGAIIGAAGVGGVLGGIALVSQDARVAAYGKALGEKLLGSLRQDASPFIAPVLAAIDTIDGAFEKLRGNFQAIFANASRYVAPLVAGLVGFLDPVVRGFDKLVAKASPVISAIKVGFQQVGSAIGDLFSSLADNGEEAGIALTFVFTAVATSIRIVGQIINGLTEAFGLMLKTSAAFAKFIPGLDGALRSAGETTRDTDSATTDLSFSFSKMADEASSATQAQIDYVAAAGQVTTANRSLYSSETDAAQAVKDATKAIRDNGRGLDVNTQKGRDNRQALSSLAGALSANYDAYVKVNGAGSRSEGVMRRNRDAFVKAAEKAGYAADKARDLADELLGIKDRTVSVTVTFNESRINAVENRLNRLHGGAFSSGDYWSAVNGNGTARTGGPSKVSVTNDVQVSLDGSPFYAMTASAIDASQDRSAWRAKVGKR